MPAWPVNTLKLMAPVPAGGGVDVLCRRIAERMGLNLRRKLSRSQARQRYLQWMIAQVLRLD